jgi:pimeloyl-ACP methyl ester carboxylesterase
MSNIYPVIFIPGIMGTTLADDYPIDHNVVYNAVFDKFEDFDPIMVDDSGQYDSYLDKLIRGNELVSLVYKKIVSEMREELPLIGNSKEHAKVYLFPYDWRYSISSNAKRLAIFVEYIIAKSAAHAIYRDSHLVVDRVNLVGHSMGGCIAKHYATLLGGESKINKLVMLASPLRGATSALKQLTMGDTWFFGLFTRKGKRRAARTFPGAFDLLPFDGYYVQDKPKWPKAAVVERGEPVNIFDVEKWQPKVRDGNKELLENRLAGASVYFGGSRNFSEPFRQNVLIVYGTGEDTLRSVIVEPNGDYDFDTAPSKAGDSTVPAVSTYCEGIHRVGVTRALAGDWDLQLGKVAGFHASFCLYDINIELAISFLTGTVLKDVAKKLRYPDQNINNIGTYTDTDMITLDTVDADGNVTPLK